MRLRLAAAIESDGSRRLAPVAWHYLLRVRQRNGCALRARFHVGPEGPTP